MAHAQHLPVAHIGFANWLHRVAEVTRDELARRRVYRRTLNELERLSARDLADLGFHRSTIRGLAWEAAYGK